MKYVEIGHNHSFQDGGKGQKGRQDDDDWLATGISNEKYK